MLLGPFSYLFLLQLSVVLKNLCAVGARHGRSTVKPEASAYGTLQTFGLGPGFGTTETTFPAIESVPFGDGSPPS